MQHYTQHNVNLEDLENAQNKLFFQKLLNRFRSIWPWLVASVLLCLLVAFFYLKIAVPEYKVNASVLVQDDKKSTDFGETSLLQEFGFNVKSTVDNEAEVFKSRTLMEQVVRELQLHIRYYRDGNMRAIETFIERPVTLRFISPDTFNLREPVKYNVQFDPANITNINLVRDDIHLKAHIGDTVTLPEGKAVILPSEGFAKWDAKEPLTIHINSIDGTTQKYMDALQVDIPNKQVSVIHLTVAESLPGKGEQILNTLISAYLQANVRDKNRIADSTMRFIDDRLRLVFRELSDIEKDIEHFKTNNRLTDLSTQSNLLLQNTSEYARNLTDFEVQLSVINALQDFLRDNENNQRIVPSSLVMQDASFIALVNRYNDLQLQRDKMLMSLTTVHPSVLSMDDQLKNMRAELVSSIASIKKGIEVSVAELKKKTAEFEKDISRVPSKERTFLDYSRQQAIKQELYLFLLKKREETAISKSATIANARIIDKAKSNTQPFKPRKSLVMMLGVVFGLLIPFAVSFGRDMINTKVSSLEDITSHTSVPILTEISHNVDNNIVAVSMKSRQLVAEQFRSLRTSLQYILSGKNEKVILITSSMSGEGKSFLSINLCTILALAGKKAILLELDLRKPKITNNLGLEKKGFTNYIIEEKPDWRKWVQPSRVQPNFDVLSSGPIPPNPTELLMMPRMSALMKELKEQYDYIIIDTPPAGMVTDAEILAAHANTTFFIVRHKYTYKQQVHIIEKLLQKQSLPRINVIVNDIPAKNPGYGYGYYYGYGYNPYEEEKPKSRIVLNGFSLKKWKK